MKGTLIVIEGTDGAGKETQTKLLGKTLCSKGLNIKEVSFPCYGTTACGPVEMYLQGCFGKNPEETNPYAASVMYGIDRFASFKNPYSTIYLVSKKVYKEWKKRRRQGIQQKKGYKKGTHTSALKKCHIL